MALNNFNASIVGRGASCASHSVVAKAAYNGREKLQDERTGATHNYATKDGLEWKGLFLPKGAPEWMNDRQKLYNEIERKEDAGTKPDKAQLVHSWILTLPHELSAEQRKWFMTDFGRELARKGRVVDIALHTPDVGGDDRNYHAHVLMTMREVNADGFGKKITAPDVKRGDKKGKEKFQKWAKDELAAWKDRYSELGAHYLERAGYAVEGERFRHGHKTLNEQLKAAELRCDAHWVRHMADREPTKHVGPQATGMERKEKAPTRTRKGDINREIEARNADRQETRKIDELLANLPAGIIVPIALDRRNVPVWLALERSKDAQGFVDNLKKEGWQLARIDKDDAAASRADISYVGKHLPTTFMEGDYAILNPRGYAFHLNERTTGRSFKDMKKFMATLDKEAVQTLREAEYNAQIKLGRIARARGGRKSGRGNEIGVLRKASRVAGVTLGMVGTGVSLLISAVDRELTPEQKVGRNLDDVKKKLAAERAEKLKKIEPTRSFERERD